MAFLCPPSAPATPDYAAAATAQGQANKDTAITQGYLNNPNIRGVAGGQTVTFDPVTNQPTITQNLTPTAQATFDAQQRVQQQMASLGERGLTSASSIIGTPFAYTGPSLTTSLANSGAIQGSPNLSAMGSAAGGFAGDRAVGTVTSGTAQGSVDNPQASAIFQGGRAAGNVAGPSLQENYSNYGTVLGAPGSSSMTTAARFGLAQGGVTGDVYGRAAAVNPSSYGLAKGNVTAGMYGLAQGDVAGDQFGLAKGDVAANQYGLAQGDVAANQ